MVVDLERKRAEYAYLQVVAWSGGPSLKAIADWLPGLPMMLRTSGLLITLATLRGKKASELAGAIEAWLTRRAPHPPLKSDREDENFQTLCFGADRSAYLAAQWEAIALAQVLKVMTEALSPAKAEASLPGKGAEP